MVLEYGTGYCAEKMCTLLKYMADSTVLTLDQITMVSSESELAYVHTVILSLYIHMHCSATHNLSLLKGFHAGFQRHD